MTSPQVLLVANTSWYLYNFRLPLMRDLRQAGYNVAVVAPRDIYTPLLEAEGFTVNPWLVSRRSINPLLELRAILDLFQTYRRVRPALVHHFTIKACLYGTLAAKAARVYRVINAVTGLGHLFVTNSRPTRLLRSSLRPLFRAVFSARRSRVVFQNADDQERLIQLGITDGNRARLIRGSGVDIQRFRPVADSAGQFQSPLQLLFPSRLIREKGIEEVLEACRLLWQRGVALELVIAGDPDDGNRSSLSAGDLRILRDDPRIRCLGHVHDMAPVYGACDLVVLTSWREGLSRSLVEAAAMERPIITSDAPGCRDVVDHGVTGLLVPLHDPAAIVLAVLLLVRNPDLARELGKAARRKVVDEFQVSLVNESTLAQYSELFAAPIRPDRFFWSRRAC